MIFQIKHCLKPYVLHEPKIKYFLKKTNMSNHINMYSSYVYDNHELSQIGVKEGVEHYTSLSCPFFI